MHQSESIPHLSRDGTSDGEAVASDKTRAGAGGLPESDTRNVFLSFEWYELPTCVTHRLNRVQKYRANKKKKRKKKYTVKQNTNYSQFTILALLCQCSPPSA